MQATRSQSAPLPDISQYQPGNLYTKSFDWIDRLSAPPNYKRVLCFLVRLCGKVGHNTSKRGFIAKRLKISPRTVTRAVLHWEELGFVTVIRQTKTANHYLLHSDVLKAAWLEVERAKALPEFKQNLKSDNLAHHEDRYIHSSIINLSSAPAGADAPARTYKEETLSASRVSAANGTTEEQKALIGEIVEIRYQLHQTNPERYSKIISPKAYTGKLATKSIQELRTELSQNRNVLENSKKPKPVAGSSSGQSIMAQANEIERTTFTGSHEPWFVAWSSLEEQDRIGWRERTEAQLWNDSGWDEWCRQHPDPVEQELARRRETRKLFRVEWEQLHAQDAAPGDVEEAGAEPDADPAGSTPDHRAETVTTTGNQVVPINDNPDDNPPPTSPKPKRRRQQQREHCERRQTNMPPATSRTPSQPLENACAGVLAQGRSHSEPTTDLPTGNVLAFRRPTRTASTEQEPRGDPDG